MKIFRLAVDLEGVDYPDGLQDSSEHIREKMDSLSKLIEKYSTTVRLKTSNLFSRELGDRGAR